MKTSFIATVYNEEKTIESFLRSILAQKRRPDEIIIVDGGSHDKTVQVIHKFRKIILLQKKGNRAMGRNFGIDHARHDIVLLSDAGCILDSSWVEEITRPFLSRKVQVVSGYYRGKARTIFQRCLIPFVLVMPDKLNPNTFLPSTRSMAIRKSVWKKIGRFPEQFSHNEDYVLALRLKESGKNMVFAKNAIVNWIPPHTPRQAFVMFCRFAYGDTEAGIYRPKVVLIFFRYLLGIVCLFIGIVLNKIYLVIFFVMLIVYLLWAAWKNFRYVKNVTALVILPFIQILSDLAVLIGTTLGSMKRILISSGFS